MSHKNGANLGGIDSLERLMDRCYVDHDTGCWHWRLSSSKGSPRVHIRLPDGSAHDTRGRRAAIMVKTGRVLPKGKQVFALDRCQSHDCVNPAHARVGTRHQSMQAAVRRGAMTTPARLESIRARCVEARKLTGEQMTELLSSIESAYALAKKMQVSKSRVIALRKQGGYLSPGPRRVSSVWDLGACS